MRGFVYIFLWWVFVFFRARRSSRSYEHIHTRIHLTAILKVGGWVGGSVPKNVTVEKHGRADGDDSQRHGGKCPHGCFLSFHDGTCSLPSEVVCRVIVAESAELVRSGRKREARVYVGPALLVSKSTPFGAIEEMIDGRPEAHSRECNTLGHTTAIGTCRTGQGQRGTE